MDSNRSGGREMQAQTPPSGPTLCRTGCGFYAHSAFDGMCSKCYKDHMAATLNSSAASSTTTTSSPLLAKASSASDTTVASSDAAVPVRNSEDLVTDTDSSACASATAEPTAEPCSSEGAPDLTQESIIGAIADISLEECSSANDKPKKKRCDICRKRVGLTGFDCRCGGHYCSMHRYSDMHQCSFDYRQLAQSEIRKHNPVIAAEKVAKI